MRLRHTLVGAFLLGTIAAPMAGGTARIAHAGTVNPAVTATDLAGQPWSTSADGTGFTPGGAVHIDVYFAVLPPYPTGPGPYQIAFSADTTAARTTRVSNGHGITFTRQGGYFTTTLTMDPTNPLCTMGGLGGITYYYYVIARDVTTGLSAGSTPIPTWCGSY